MFSYVIIFQEMSLIFQLKGMQSVHVNQSPDK